VLTTLNQIYLSSEIQNVTTWYCLTELIETHRFINTENQPKALSNWGVCCFEIWSHVNGWFSTKVLFLLRSYDF